MSNSLQMNGSDHQWLNILASKRLTWTWVAIRGSVFSFIAMRGLGHGQQVLGHYLPRLCLLIQPIQTDCAQNYPRRGATQLFQRVNASIEDQILCIVLTWLHVCVMALGPVDCAERGCRWSKKVRVPWYMFTSCYVNVRPSFKGIKEIRSYRTT